MKVFSSLFTPNVKPHTNPSKLPSLSNTHHRPGARLKAYTFFLSTFHQKKQQQQQQIKPSTSCSTLQLGSQGLSQEILCIMEAWWVEAIRSDRQGRDFRSCSSGASAVIPPAVQTVTLLIRGCHARNGREATLWNIQRSSSISHAIPYRVLEIRAYRKWRSGLS